MAAKPSNLTTRVRRTERWVLLVRLCRRACQRRAVWHHPGLDGGGITLTDALREGGRTGTATRGRRVRQVLVVLEMALALVLLVGAGLLVRSFTTLMQIDPGFDPSRTVTMKVTLPSANYRGDGQSIAFFDRLFDRVDTIPGVQAAGGVSFLPLNGLGAATSFFIEGQEKPRPGDEPVSDVKVVTHDYFKAMGIPLLRGRLFDGRDTAPKTRRIIVSEIAREEVLRRRRIQLDAGLCLSWNDQGPTRSSASSAICDRRASKPSRGGASYLPPARFAYPFTTVVVKTADDGMSSCRVGHGRPRTRSGRAGRRHHADDGSHLDIHGAAAADDGHADDVCGRWRSCWPRSASTGSSAIPSRSAPRKLGSAWRLARSAAMCCGWLSAVPWS